MSRIIETIVTAVNLCILLGIPHFSPLCFSPRHNTRCLSCSTTSHQRAQKGEMASREQNSSKLLQHPWAPGKVEHTFSSLIICLLSTFVGENCRKKSTFVKGNFRLFLSIRCMLGLILWMNSVVGTDERITCWHMKEMLLGNFLSMFFA